MHAITQLLLGQSTINSSKLRSINIFVFEYTQAYYNFYGIFQCIKSKIFIYYDYFHVQQ